MHNPRLAELLSHTNTAYPARVATWSVFDHETSNSTEFDNKLDAVLYQRTRSHATAYFHWYESQFASVDFRIEPPESLAELCKQRAQELRDTYSYITLWFSGGSDSATALRAFTDNNIHIDEIVMCKFLEQNTDHPEQTSNRELLLAADPYLKNLSKQLALTKITVLQQQWQDVVDWHSDPDDQDHVQSLHTMDGDSGLFHCSVGGWGLTKWFRENRHRPNSCNLIGGTKARVYTNNEQWYFYMVDSSMPEWVHSRATEDFFVSKSHPRLFLKTVYSLKNYFQSQGYSAEVVNGFHKDPARSIEYNRALGRVPVHVLAQLKYDSTVGSSDLQQQFMLGETRSWYLYKNISSQSGAHKLAENFVQRQRIMQQQFGFLFNTDAQGNPLPILGWKGLMTKFHCLNNNVSYNSTQVL